MIVKGIKIEHKCEHIDNLDLLTGSVLFFYEGDVFWFYEIMN